MEDCDRVLAVDDLAASMRRPGGQPSGPALLQTRERWSRRYWWTFGIGVVAIAFLWFLRLFPWIFSDQQPEGDADREP